MAGPREVTSDELLYATRAWLVTMRRLWVRRYGSGRGECPVRPLEEYSPADQAVMMSATKAALLAGDPEAAKRMRSTIDEG